jgi:hypothetical protein
MPLMTDFDVVSMTATLFSDESATYALSLLAKAIPQGSSKRVAPVAGSISWMVAMTVW